MSTTQEHDVLARIDELPELVPLPAIALELLNACKDPNIGAKDLCQIVSCDSSLAVRLLQISNSTLYGCGGQIKTVEHASVVLGVRGLRDLAVSVVTVGLFSDSREQNPSAGLLWRHSLGCATVAKAIVEIVDGVCPDEAFITGIVHDVGKLVLIQLLQEKYDLIPKALAGESTVESEKQLYGICHAELGMRCAEEWGLPFEMSEALRNHHVTYDSAVHSRLSSVMAAANQLSKLWTIGTDSELDIDAKTICEANELPFDENQLSEIQQQCTLDYAQNQKAFEV